MSALLSRFRSFPRYMRNAIVIGVVFVVVGAIAVAYAALSTAPTGQKTWYWQNPLPQGNTLNAVDAPVGSHVWAVGGPGIVLHSSDDGAEWEPQDPGTQVTLRGVSFVSDQTGWVVGDSSVIRRTIDGGQTWASQGVATAITARAVSMADSSTGWIVGSGGAIRKTVNGGSTNWTTVTSPTTQILYAVSAVDSTHAWAVGAAGTIISTSNGTSWAAQTSSTTQTLNAVSFVDTMNGYAVGSPRATPSRGTVLKTTDGGVTWTPLSVSYLGATGTPTALTSIMRAVSFRDANTGWIAGDAGLVLFTNDGGVTWTSQKSGAQTIYAVAAAEGAKGHLVGQYGTMLRTETNGTSWRGQQQGTTNRLNSGSWTGPTSGIVVGAAGLVMKTEDAGDSWASRTLGANDLYAVKFVDGSNGWVVGSGGFLRKTSDAGATWVPQSSGTTQILYSVTGVDSQTAWAVGAGGVILKTIDGGTTWLPKNSNTVSTLYDVYFIDANNGWAVGGGGTVRRTVDGGETWTSQTSGVTSTIYSVQFLDANTGWFTSTTGRLRKTTNGGALWVAQTVPTTKALYSVEMADANNGWAVGGDSAGSVALRTTNGGANWVAQDVGFRGILRQVTVANPSVAGVVGDAGAMRRTFDAGATWETTGFWSVNTYRDLSFPSDNEGWTVGDGGVIAHTHDGGRTWGAQQSGGTNNLYSVDFVDENRGWAVGAAGAIRTTVTHTTWATQASGVTANLWGVDFVDQNTGWAVGAAGTVLKTSNGGTNWAAQTSNVPTTTILYGVSAVDTQTVFAYGAGGTLARTVDGGSTWTVSTVSASTLNGGHFVDSQTGWVVGTSGVVLKTLNGGASWTPQTANAGTTELRDVWFTDSLNGYLVGLLGVVRKTANGGTTWTTQNPGTANTLYSIGFTDADHGWLVGQYGTILRTTDSTPPDTQIVVDPPAPNGNNGWFIGKPQISFVSNEPGLTYYSWTSATGPWTTFSAPVVPPMDGQQTIYWYSVDPGGNIEAVKSMVGKVDATLPSTPSTPSVTTESSSGVTFAWAPSTDAASGMDYYEVQRNGSLVGTTTATSFAASSLATGTVYAFVVHAIDMAGNVSDSSGELLFSIDTTPPVTSASIVPISPNGVNGWYVTTPTVTLTTNEPATSYYSWTSASGPWSSYATSLVAGEGTRTLSYYSVDPVGNVEATRGVMLKTDTVAPSSPSALATSTVTTSSIDFSWSASTDAASGFDHYEVWANGSRVSTTTATSMQLNGLTPNLLYSLSVVAVDVAGLKSAPSAVLAVRADPLITTPIATTITFSPVSPDGQDGWYVTTPTVSLSTVVTPANVRYSLDLSGAGWSVYGAPFQLPAGQGTVWYSAIDPFGIRNPEPTQTAVFKVDTTAPGTPVVAADPPDYSSVKLRWSAVAAAPSGVARYEVYRDGSTVGSATDTSFTATGLSASTVYAFTVKAVDNAGNESALSAAVTVTTDDSAPVTTASLTPVSADGLDGWYRTAPSIMLTSNEPGTTYYGWTTNTGPWTAYSSALTAAEGTTTLYYYSVDPLGNTETTRSIGLRTDTLRPSAPSALTTGSVTTSTIGFSWSPSTDAASGVAHYEIYSSLSLIATTTATSINLTGLLPETPHSLTVAAVDKAGNTSALSAELLVTTALLDRVAITTTTTAAPLIPDGLAGWYVTTPAVSFSTDIVPATVRYSFDLSGSGWTEWAGTPVDVPEGNVILSYSSVDPNEIRNPETTRAVAFKVDVTPPSTPVVSVSTTEYDRVVLWWDPVLATPSGLARYDVFKDGVLVSSTATTSSVVAGLSENTGYTFAVRAVDKAGNSSAMSAPLVVTTSYAPNVAAPAIVYARGVAGDTAFINWLPSVNTVGVVSYIVYRSENASDYAQVGQTDGWATAQYIDSGLHASTTYYYAVAARDNRGQGALSEHDPSRYMAIATTTTAPRPPVGLTAQEASGSVTIGWQRLSDPTLTGYVVRRSAASGSVGTTLTLLPATKSSFEDTTAVNYESYWYTVAAIDAQMNVGQPSIEAFARPRSAATYVDPHRTYKDQAADGNGCTLCHVIHAAPGKAALLKTSSSDPKALCLGCHDGTGANGKTATDYADPLAVSRHPVAVGTQTGSMVCGSCHASHSSEATGPLDGLLSPTSPVDGSKGASHGPGVCYTCHGEDSTLPGGDMRAYEDSAHHTKIAPPDTGSEVTCNACHMNHSSRNEALLRYTGYQDCLQCHAQGGSLSAPDIYTRLTVSADSSAHHDISAADQAKNGSRMSCQNCHNTHTASSTYPLVDPDDPSTSGIWKKPRSQQNEFCLTCHDGTLPTAVQTEPWAAAPLAANGSTHTADIESSYAASMHGSGTGTARHLRNDMGYAVDTVLACAACHEPHGTVNDYSLRYDVPNADGTSYQMGALVHKIADGEYDMRFFCNTCHDITAAQHADEAPEAPMWSPDEPNNCTASNCHRHSGASF